LKQAQINLSETKLYAPSDGGITNLTVDEGFYAKSGTALMTFISGTDVWVKAYLRENSLSNLKIGDPVEILLDVAPGKIFKGEVSTIGYGVSQPSGGATGELETVQADSGWLRDAQRFPVIIKFSDDNSRGIRRHGGQADVQIYTGDHFIVNTLGRIWIRLMSYLSYVY
jgi:multidrug resistance efflux pump